MSGKSSNSSSSSATRLLSDISSETLFPSVVEITSIGSEQSKYSSAQGYDDNVVNVARESVYKFYSTVINSISDLPFDQKCAFSCIFTEICFVNPSMKLFSASFYENDKARTFA